VAGRNRARTLALWCCETVSLAAWAAIVSQRDGPLDKKIVQRAVAERPPPSATCGSTPLRSVRDALPFASRI